MKTHYSDFRAEVRDRINMIDAALETQCGGTASVPVEYLSDMRSTLERIPDEVQIPTLTEYVKRVHGGAL